MENVTEMRSVVREYFLKVFAKPERELSNEAIVCPRRVLDDQNESLTKEVSFEEFTFAIKQMHPDKTSE